MLFELLKELFLILIIYIIYTVGKIHGISEGFHKGIKSAVYFIDFKDDLTGEFHSIALRNGDTLEIAHEEDGTISVNKPEVDKTKIKVRK